MAPQATS